MEALHQWYEQILEHIRESDLKNLSGYETENGENPFQKFTDVTRRKETLKPFSYSDFKHGDEFNYISMDLIYIIAIIELLHPNTNNSLKENGTYHQTTEDHLYLRYAGFGFQTIYSYWDRIGDVLDLFFNTGQSGDVYLGRVFRNFPTQFRSDTYVELLILYKSQVESVLFDRHGVVHTFGLKSRHFWGVMAAENEMEMKTLQYEKDSYPKTFRRQLDSFFQGFSLNLSLLRLLPGQQSCNFNKPIFEFNCNRVEEDFLNLTIRNVGKLDLKALSAYHRSHSDISFESYKKHKHSEIASSVAPYKKIYLDVLFWIGLRNAIHRSEKQKPYFGKLFKILKEKVQEKRIVCPYSGVLFDELLKQNILWSRRRTAQLADILSGSYTLTPLYHIICSEVYNLILEAYDLKTKSDGKLNGQINYTWTRPIELMGSFNLKTKPDLTDEELALKKIHYDVYFEQTFQEVIAANDQFHEDMNSANWHAEMVNNSKSTQQDIKISFAARHKRELQSTYESAVRHIKISNVDFAEIISKSSLDKLRQMTPVTYIYTAIYTNFQQDKTRIIQPNDYYDLAHSSLAIGTCDYFFTERSFCALLKSTKLDQKFGVIIESDPAKILELVSKL
jgi:hypothetical protein